MILIMVIAEIDPSSVAYTYAHLSGIVACAAVVGIVVGCVFRYHTDESPLHWAFAGCVMVWYITHPALLDYFCECAYESSLSSGHIYLSYDYNQDIVKRMLQAGAGLTTAVYAWLFCYRNSFTSFIRLLVTLVVSAVLSTSISLLTGPLVTMATVMDRYPA
jgi:hypothetical protein